MLSLKCYKSQPIFIIFGVRSLQEICKRGYMAYSESEATLMSFFGLELRPITEDIFEKECKLFTYSVTLEAW